MKNLRQHYFMVAGEVTFAIPPVEGADINTTQVGKALCNALVTADKQTVGVATLARANTNVQMNFFKKIEDPTTKVVDVVILNLMYLGFMTAEEFQKTPPGVKMTEVPNV